MAIVFTLAKENPMTIRKGINAASAFIFGFGLASVSTVYFRFVSNAIIDFIIGPVSLAILVFVIVVYSVQLKKNPGWAKNFGFGYFWGQVGFIIIILPLMVVYMRTNWYWR
jgi:hypothetical protein